MLPLGSYVEIWQLSAAMRCCWGDVGSWYIHIGDVGSSKVLS